MTIKTEGFVSIDAIQRESTLRQALIVCCQLDVADRQIKTVGESTFGRLREEAVSVWNEMVEKVGGDPEKLDLEAVRGAFEHRLTVEENWIRSEECPFKYDEGKLPRKWIEAKSQIGIAIENGFNFREDPYPGQSALRKFNKDQKDEAEKRKQQERARKAAEAGASPSGVPSNKPEGKTNDPTPTGDAGDVPAGQGDGNNTAPANQPPLPDKAASVKIGGTALSEEQVEKLQHIAEMLNDIATVKGNGSIEKSIASFEQQITAMHGKVTEALKKLANVA